MPDEPNGSDPCESHGRELTTTPLAARYYRIAQGRHRDRPPLLAALGAAIRADPGFALAAADMAALDPGHGAAAARPRHPWERHHIEIVATAAGGNPGRAADLLREHLSVVRCDPIATAVVVRASGIQALDDILRDQPECHRQRDAQCDAQPDAHPDTREKPRP